MISNYEVGVPFDKSLFEDSRQLVLHVDNRPGTELRGKIFGHAGIITFREGFLAKKLDDFEGKFYQLYRKKLHVVFPQELLPEIFGISYISSKKDDELTLDFQPSLTPDGNETRQPLILEKDIAAGYARPAMLDLKLGIRSWKIGASEKKAKRRSAKIQGGSCACTNFRIRAAMWYSDTGKFPKDGEMTIVERKFGNTCSLPELHEFFADFFKCKEAIPNMIRKLEILKESLTVLRDQYGVRFYSSSLLAVYDDTNPLKFDLRMLDFEKSYAGVEDICKQFHESLESCEDGVIEAVTNIISILEETIPK